MAFAGIAPPDPFLPTPGRPVQPWSRWHDMFKVYLLASGASEFSPERRKAILLHSLGPEGHIEGFVDLGDHTPADQKNALADHGMVVLFQPFTGNWTQILGVFASKANVKSATLAKIIVETAILAEKSGLFVDCITCDGASWNRSMWRLFGIQGAILFPKYLEYEFYDCVLL
ncbi:hypothetical protein MTO96_015136 [Rhipicephalus appendiculatus]